MKLTPTKEDEIVQAYRDWDGSESVDSFIRPYGVSKQTLYGLLRRRQEPTKKEAAYIMGKAADGDGALEPELADWLVDQVAKSALKTILEENRRVHLLEARIEQLEQALREAGENPDLV